jgi:hypothetical protein
LPFFRKSGCPLKSPKTLPKETRVKVQHPLARAGVIGLALAVSACSVIQEDKIDYKSAQKASTLEVPPDLTQLSKDTRYTTTQDKSVSAWRCKPDKPRCPRLSARPPCKWVMCKFCVKATSVGCW